MRIIEKMPQEQIHTCASCGCKFAYEEDDTYSTPYGTAVLCPRCGDEIALKLFDRVLQFPNAYYHFGDGSKMSDRTIEEWVKQCVKRCVVDDVDFAYAGSGDSMVYVYQVDEDGALDIVVAKNYYSTTIEREDAKAIINYS